MKLLLNQEEYRSALKSYNNIFAFFLNSEEKPKHFLECIYKWGVQLGVTKEDLKYVIENPQTIKFEQPENKESAIEQIYDLVYIIYLDEIIEDLELEVASAYAEKLGFKPHIVGDMLKALVTAPYDGVNRSQVKNEVKELAKTPVLK